MRHVPDDIAKPVLDWIDENVPTPEGPPVVNARVKLDAVHDHLFGPLPPGSDAPTSGTRTYAIDLRFLAAPGTKQVAIDQLLAGLRLAAAEEPQIYGLPDRGRLFLGKDTVEAVDDHEDPDHDGPIVTLAARVSVLAHGPERDDVTAE